jgi:hypothetical protein
MDNVSPATGFPKWNPEFATKIKALPKSVIKK